MWSLGKGKPRNESTYVSAAMKHARVPISDAYQLSDNKLEESCPEKV